MKVQFICHLTLPEGGGCFATYELHTKILYSSACSNYSRKLGKLKRKNEYLHGGFICHEITPGGKWGVCDIWITICNLYLSASSKYECKYFTKNLKIWRHNSQMRIWKLYLYVTKHPREISWRMNYQLILIFISFI